ncbi:eukaryotic translation initiation factor 3 subunit A-like [Vicia villosa]|uniref:eukaryotic translation initiation factor 3 subunit A-like n=1 Tax=Vicia villosa TaxID=3911 RepID=UPI00273CD3C3|nr:eukaryotic translation initiation factor 3 subunit A-like [Vicia villosa]
MAASSSHIADSSSPHQQHQQEEEQLFFPSVTCSIPREDLEVIFYPNLVKDLWAYASVIPKAVVSFVHGRFFAIIEDTLRILFDLKEPAGAFELSRRANWADVLAELYPDVTKTKNVKDLKDIYKMVEKLESDGVIKDLVTVTGSILNANTLRKTNLIQAVEHAPQPIPGIRIRRGPVLAEFEMFFSKELSEVEVKYRKTLKKGSANDAPARVSRQKPSSSKAEVSEDVPEVVPEVAHHKERRTKRKHDLPSVNEEKDNQEDAAAEVDENVVENEVEKKKKKDKKKKNKSVEKRSEEEMIQEEVNREEEEKEAARKRELALEKIKAVSEKKKR